MTISNELFQLYSLSNNMLPQTMIPNHQSKNTVNGEQNDIEDFLNLLIDDNSKAQNQQQQHQQQPQQQMNQQNNMHQQQHMQQHSQPMNIQTNNHSPPPTVPEVKIKCEDTTGNPSEYPHSDGGDCLFDQMSPFSHSGASSPGSSCSGMSAPGSPVMMDHSNSNNAPPPYAQNYLSPESAFFMNQPGSPGNISGNQSGDSSSSYKYEPRPLGRKKRRQLVPEDKKNNEYWEKRKRNNVAARRSREERRTKELQTFETMKHLQQENNALKQTINMLMENQKELQQEIIGLRHCLQQAMYKPS